MRRFLAGLIAIVMVGACGTGSEPSAASSASATSPGTQLPTQAAPSRSPSPTTATTPKPPIRTDWPYVRESCASEAGDPIQLVALGTSETAGYAMKTSRIVSPDLAHPAQYADVVCGQLGRPVLLHSYYPFQLGAEYAPIEWWIGKVGGDAALRADLAGADIVILWALSVHDSVLAMLVPGACTGAWPDPLQACLEDRLAAIPAKTDQLFGLIDGLIGTDTVVLASDAYAVPLIVSTLADNPNRDDIRALLDPYKAVSTYAPTHGFVFVDTELRFNGPSRFAMPAEGLFVADNVHPTEAGARLIAQTYLDVDGIDD